MKRHLHRLGAAAVSGALLASLLTACGGGITAETPSVVPESPAQQTEQAVAETRTVTDAAGNVVEVPAELSRIAVTPLPWSSVIYAIDGTSEHMVSINPGAMTAYTNCFSPSWTAVMRSWTPPSTAPTSPSTWRKWSAEASRLW